MLPLPKKLSGKPSAVTKPAWHPNFRMVERLPDIKPVRTIFFINGGAVLIALFLLIFVGTREVRLYNIRQETVAAKSIIDQNKPASDQAVALFNKFKEQEKGIFALQKFLSAGKLVLSDFVLQVGSTLPQGVRISAIDYKPTGVLLRGDIAGTADEASGLSYAYIDKLRKDAGFSELFDVISLNTIVKDPGTGHIRFEASLKLRASSLKAKGGGK